MRTYVWFNRLTHDTAEVVAADADQAMYDVLGQFPGTYFMQWKLVGVRS